MQKKHTRPLEILRLEIDKVDRNLRKFLLEREKLVKKIGKLKTRNKIRITDKKREKQVLSKAKTKFVKEIFKKIVKEAKRIQVKNS